MVVPGLDNPLGVSARAPPTPNPHHNTARLLREPNPYHAARPTTAPRKDHGPKIDVKVQVDVPTSSMLLCQSNMEVGGIRVWL